MITVSKVKSAKELPISTRLLATVYRKDYLYEVLDALYKGSPDTDHRRYHTLDHIDWCLKQMVLVEDSDIRSPTNGTPMWNELEMGILFHDAVCIPGNKVNEHLSADIAAGFIQSSCSTLNMGTNWVTSMIRNTAALPLETVYTLNPVERILRDIDHSILASTWETYQVYAKRVRQEYMTTMIPDWVFNRERIAFLTDMLERARKSRLFTTSRFAQLNNIAAINITKEKYALECLKEGAVLGGD